MITQLNYEIIKCKGWIIDKFELITTAMIKKNKLKMLFDKQWFNKVQKSIERE